MFKPTDPSPREIETLKLALGREPRKEPRLKQLARWEHVRSKNLLIFTPKNTHRLKVCACSGVKAMSASRCHACQEARRIIASKTPSLGGRYYHDKRLTRTERMQCKLPVANRANKELISCEQNNVFDNIVRLYEDCQ